MATITGSTSSSLWTYKLEVTEGSYSIENNTSPVTVKAYIGRASSRSYLGGNWSGSITVAGSTQNMSGTISYPTYIDGGGWLLLATKTFTVTHNNDGSKVASVSSSFSSSDFTPSSASASGNVTLATIPRASSITCTSAYIGESAQITVNRKSSNFTHVIAYSFTGSGGSESKYILADGTTTSTRTKITATSIGFPFPSSWYALMPNDSEITANIAIDTYSGDTQIGNTQRSTFKIRVNPTNNKPIITASVADTNQTTLALTGNNNYLVKGFSTANVTWSSTGQNSATITNTQINGTTVTQSPYSFTLNSTSIVVTATDSRGFTNEGSPTFTLKNYFIPNITTSGFRDEPTSSYMNIKFNGTFWNDNFGTVDNSLSISWKYRESGESDWTNGGIFVENTDYKISSNNFYSGTGDSASEIQIGGTMTYDKAWDIGIFVNDELYTMPVQIVNITKGIPIIWWNEDSFNVTGDLNVEGTFNFNNYSETEKRVGTFFDVPLYSISFLFQDTIQADTNFVKAHGIQNADVVFVDLSHSFMVNSMYESYPIIQTGYNNQFTDKVFIHANRTNFTIRSVGGWGANWVKIITLLYTKTTD